MGYKRRKSKQWLTAPEERMWWRAPVEVDAEEAANRGATLGKTWQPYNVSQAYAEARRRFNPVLAPHGLFRELRQAHAGDAEKFLKEYGPLELTPPPGALPPAGLHNFTLEYFWSRQLRFRLVTGLWESLNDRITLLKAWRAITENHQNASLRQSVPLGFREKPPAHPPAGASLGPGMTRESPPFPWNIADVPFEKWEKEVDFAEAKEKALALIRQEMELHTAECTIIWENGWEATGERFRSVFRAPSLLAMMWELFGRDTSGVAWRRCPHCQILFYPKRHDQFYCTVRQQTLASKRNYAARMRIEEKRRAEARRRARAKAAG